MTLSTEAVQSYGPAHLIHNKPRYRRSSPSLLLGTSETTTETREWSEHKAVDQRISMRAAQRGRRSVRGKRLGTDLGCSVLCRFSLRRPGCGSESEGSAVMLHGKRRGLRSGERKVQVAASGWT